MTAVRPDHLAVPPRAVVILAAGEGTRMKSATPKVLHSVAGRSLLGHVLAAAKPLGARHVIVVVGHGREQVTDHVAAYDPDARCVVQDEQRGTGHAVRIALESIHSDAEAPGPVVVLAGDTPLITTDALRELVGTHVDSHAAATILSALLHDASGYGRILRDNNGNVTGIVEQKDATEAQLSIREINSGMYAFDEVPLRRFLTALTTNNAQGEEYLTDVIGLMRAEGLVVTAVPSATAEEILGVNDRIQLSEARVLIRDRIAHHWMTQGVTIIDPLTTWIDVDVELERDVVVEPGTSLLGATRINEGAHVGPDSTLSNTTVDASAVVVRTHSEGALIGAGATVGPFTYLRPGTVLGPKSKAGAYVEIKNSTIGAASKVPHLSYIGDTTVGENSNIGAATVTVNYDGINKHKTVIGDDVRVGSDTMLVAPVVIGDGAYTAAGSVITEDVPPGAMAVGRARQRNVEGWVSRKRPHAKTTEAADAAAGEQQDPTTHEGQSR